MEKNRKNFLHKVVEFLVKDTIIDYGDNHIDFPFFPSYRLYINDANVDYFFHKGRYSQYCTDNYGLSHEESLYVWGIYIDMIKEKINNRGESLNESDGIRGRFHNKVLEYLISDSEIKYSYGNWYLISPWIENYDIRFPHMGLFHSILPYTLNSTTEPFGRYCKKMYGLTEQEIYDMWSRYVDEMRNRYFTISRSKTPVNESDDRRKNFLDKVVDFLVKDTKVDYEDRELFFPFTLKKSLRQNTDNSTPFHKILFNRDSVIPLDGFMEYIEEMYGITDIKEVSYVWGKYKDVMRYTVFGNDPTSEPIYESEDKRKGYLNKIIVLLVTGTIIDWKEERVRFPYLPEYNFAFFQYPFTTLGKVPTHLFTEYCKEQYGLTEDEIEYVWKFYVDTILGEYNNKSKLSDSSFMNESEDNKQKYLDKIIDWLVRDTDVNSLWFEPPYKTGNLYGENSITFNSLYKQTFHLLKYVTDVESVKFAIQKNYFKKFCEEQYGLTEDETEYVWKGFMKDLYESEKYNSLNESEDRKQKYLDKILKWFVDDTIIRYETGVIIYPFSPIGPNGKPLPSFIDDLKNKLSWGMSSDIQITCRDTYGLNYDETKYIWNNYKKIIKDRYNKESIMYDLKPINESENKKQVYLDKIVDWLVRDTEVGNSWFNPPYYYPGSSAGRTGFKSVYEHTFGLSRNNTYSGLDSQLIYFDSYCKNNYGLTGEETKIVWHQYMKKLKESYDWGF